MEFDENFVNVLVVESPRVMAEIVEGLCNQCAGEDGDFVFSSSDQILKIPNLVEMVIDPIRLDFNNRKILNRLYNELEEVGRDVFLEKEDLNRQNIQLIDSVVENARYHNISYKMELAWKDLFKIYDLKIAKEYDFLAEKLIEYLNILANLTEVLLLVLVNVRSFLEEEDLQNLYEQAFYQKMQLLLIEHQEVKNGLSEKTYIIDRDRCFIVK